MTDKISDLAGPGISDYGQVARDLPDNYQVLLPPMERMRAVYAVKRYIEANLCKELKEVTVSVWPQELKDICANKNIHLLE
jgi:aspartate--ammonia ligase